MNKTQRKIKFEMINKRFVVFSLLLSFMFISFVPIITLAEIDQTDDPAGYAAEQEKIKSNQAAEAKAKEEVKVNQANVEKQVKIDQAKATENSNAQLEKEAQNRKNINTQTSACKDGKKDVICNPLDGTNSLDDFLQKLLKTVNVLAAMAVTFFIIYAGFQYVTAMGDTTKIESAHNTLKWTVIGAAILFGAQVLADIIKNTVTELSKVK